MNGLSGDVWQILKRSLMRFDEERGFQTAAGISFFAVFSFVPLLLILAAVSSFLFESMDVQDLILDTILKAIPVAPQAMIRQNLAQMLDARGAVGALSGLVLLFAASAVFSSMAYSLNRAWPDAPDRNPIKARIYAMLMVVCLVGLLPLFFIGTTMMHMVTGISAYYGIEAYISTFIRFLPNIILYSFILISFVSLYRLVPNTRVRWREALVGAFTAVAATGLVTTGFSWYLRSGLSSYNIVYGSLSVLIAYMSWTYVVSLIIVYGAHLSSAIAYYTRVIQEKEPQLWN